MVSPDPLGLSGDALGFLKFISLLLRLSKVPQIHFPGFCFFAAAIAILRILQQPIQSFLLTEVNSAGQDYQNQ
jgi:hypothetical protein